MLKPQLPEASRVRAVRLVTLIKDKNSQPYFMLRYVGPASVLALLALIHSDVSNLETLDGNLEKQVFIVSLFVVTASIWKKVSAIEIHHRTHPLGGRLPSIVIKLFYLLFFSAFVSVVLVWGALNINQILDISQPREIAADVKTKKIKGGVLRKVSYELQIVPELPHMNRISLKVHEKLYTETMIGKKIILVVKKGALGSPYAVEARPYETSNAIRNDDEKPP